MTNRGVRLALVVLNGQIVLRPSDFGSVNPTTGQDDDRWDREWDRMRRARQENANDQTPLLIEKPVTLRTGNNEIIVAFISRVGTSVTLEIVKPDPANHAPTADAGGPYSVYGGQGVTFDGTGSTDPDGDTLSYNWDFGDGATATGATPTHTYAQGGQFNASLTVSDGRGGTNTASATVSVNALPIATPAVLTRQQQARRSASTAAGRRIRTAIHCRLPGTSATALPQPGRHRPMRTRRAVNSTCR